MAEHANSDGPITSVKIEALVAMKILKHASQTFPSVATGSLVGMGVGGTLEITNSFPFPTTDSSSSDSHLEPSHAAAPRAKSNIAYQNEMIKYLREVNIDANNVGWYTSTNMGNFINLNTIENQFLYQKELNERTVALVYDPARSTQGSTSLHAFRLSPSFMTAFKEGKFTVDSIQKSSLRYQDILVELPIEIHNSHILTSLLHELPQTPSAQAPEIPSTVAGLNEVANGPPSLLHPNLDSLDLSIDPFLEKTCDLLLDSIENHQTEQNNHQYYQRSLAREQAKITAWQQKRKAENAARTASKQTPLPEDEWQKLFKLPGEPSRLEIMLNSRQVEQYGRQIDGFTGTISGKMFAVKNNMLPGERD